MQKTRAAALGLRALDVKPDAVITSPYVRAAQTAEIFAEALGFPPEKIRVSETLKPTANPAETLKEIARLKAREAMCVGHAPQLDLMIAQLAGARGVVHGAEEGGRRLPRTCHRPRPLGAALDSHAEDAPQARRLIAFAPLELLDTFEHFKPPHRLKNCADPSSNFRP